MQTPLRVERLRETEQIVLVGAAAVVEDQQALRRAVGGALHIYERAHGSRLGCRRGGARVRERRQRALELRAQVLVLGREPQRLTEVVGRLVYGEAGRRGGDLEQDALRLTEVDRVEVVAVDHGRDMHARGGDPLLPRHMVDIGRVPRDVMDGAGPLGPMLARRLIGPVERAGRTGEAVGAGGVGGGEAERLGQQPRVGLERPADVGAGALDAGDRMLGRDLGVHGPAAVRLSGLARTSSSPRPS